MSRSDNTRRWLLLGLLAILSLSLFFIPAFVIQPFKYQSERALWMAIAIKRIAPALTVIAFVGMLAFAVRLWRMSSGVARTGVVMLLILGAASAVMVRQNYFEWMFHPIAAAGFVLPADAHLADDEMVMAVRIGTDARAYPIVQMGYHHILNDTVATVPIVVTY